MCYYIFVNSCWILLQDGDVADRISGTGAAILPPRPQLGSTRYHYIHICHLPVFHHALYVYLPTFPSPPPPPIPTFLDIFLFPILLVLLPVIFAYFLIFVLFSRRIPPSPPF